MSQLRREIQRASLFLTLAGLVLAAVPNDGAAVVGITILGGVFAATSGVKI